MPCEETDVSTTHPGVVVLVLLSRLLSQPSPSARYSFFVACLLSCRRAGFATTTTTSKNEIGLCSTISRAPKSASYLCEDASLQRCYVNVRSILGHELPQPVALACCAPIKFSLCVRFLFFATSRKEERRLGSMLFPAFKLQKILRAKVLLLPSIDVVATARFFCYYSTALCEKPLLSLVCRMYATCISLARSALASI